MMCRGLVVLYIYLHRYEKEEKKIIGSWNLAQQYIIWNMTGIGKLLKPHSFILCVFGFFKVLIINGCKKRPLPFPIYTAGGFRFVMSLT